MNVFKMMKDLKKMQAKMQEDLEALEVEGSAGGGVVTVRMNGKKQLLSLKLAPDAITPDDPELMEDLLMAAVNEAGKQVDQEVERMTQGMATGLGIPGLVRSPIVSDLAPPLERVINELSKLPSVGKKTAQRLALHLLQAPREDAVALARAIVEMRERVRFCGDCFNLSDQERCAICVDPRREPSLLCVVEEPGNLLALERSGAFKGLYHVLGGALSPLKDIGPDDLHLRELMQRVGQGAFREIILATNPDVEGEATAVYLSRLLKPLGLKITRLAQGLPAGGNLEFTDDLTLRRAFEGRRDY